MDDPVPSPGGVNTGAAIRATVLLGLSFWLYSVMQPSDMLMAMVAAMVIVFPTRQRVWNEAGQRIRATFYGGAMAAVVLWAFTLSPHLPILLELIFLAGMWFGRGIFDGPHPGMVYQNGFSVMLSLVAGALRTQDPGYATFTRFVLTLAGAFTAAFAVALPDDLTNWHGRGAAPA